MPETAKETVAVEETQLASVSCKVKLESYQKLSYFAMKRSMQSGSKQTLSKVAGEVLDQAAEQLDAPPADLLS